MEFDESFTEPLLHVPTVHLLFLVFIQISLEVLRSITRAFLIWEYGDIGLSISYTLLLLHYWLEFNETLTDLFLDINIVHFLF